MENKPKTEEEIKEIERKQKLFIEEYDKLIKKHGMGFTPTLQYTQQGIIPYFDIMDIKKESPVYIPPTI